MSWLGNQMQYIDYAVSKNTRTSIHSLPFVLLLFIFLTAEHVFCCSYAFYLLSSIGVVIVPLYLLSPVELYCQLCPYRLSTQAIKYWAWAWFLIICDLTSSNPLGSIFSFHYFTFFFLCKASWWSFMVKKTVYCSYPIETLL